MMEKRLILNEKQINWFNDQISLLFDDPEDDVSVLRSITDVLMFLIDTQTEEHREMSVYQRKLMEENKKDGSNFKL